jgi:hypothetical protein
MSLQSAEAALSRCRVAPAEGHKNPLALLVYFAGGTAK